ncbi:MAG: hypothetical protein ACLSA6_07715 [Holdemania massiliensis]
MDKSPSVSGLCVVSECSRFKTARGTKQTLGGAAALSASAASRQCVDNGSDCLIGSLAINSVPALTASSFNALPVSSGRVDQKYSRSDIAFDHFGAAYDFLIIIFQRAHLAGIWLNRSKTPVLQTETTQAQPEFG